MSQLPALRGDDTFQDDDGVRIHYYSWRPARPRAIVQLVHGLGEYATRYEEFAQALVRAGYGVWAGDLRGHGRTGLEQWNGDASRLGRLGPGGLRSTIAGVRALSGIVRQEHPHAPLVLLGHSLGSLLAQKILDADASGYDAAVLSGSAYRTLRHMNSGDLNRRHRRLGPTSAEWLSRDRAVVDAFAADPLTFDATAAKLFGIRESLRLLGRPKRLARDVPLLLQVGEDDALGGPHSVELLAQAYRRAGLSDVTVYVYPAARHEVYNEINRDEVIGDLVAWLDAHLPGRA